MLCTKLGVSAEVFWPRMLPKGSKERRHFSVLDKRWGKFGAAVARCKIVKYTACRRGHCAVKKHVRCHSVCPLRPGKFTSGKWKGYGKDWNRGSNTPDCGKHGRSLCKGGYKNNATKTWVSFGAIACRQ